MKTILNGIKFFFTGMLVFVALIGVISGLVLSGLWAFKQIGSFFVLIFTGLFSEVTATDVAVWLAWAAVAIFFIWLFIGFYKIGKDFWEQVIEKKPPEDD